MVEGVEESQAGGCSCSPAQSFIDLFATIKQKNDTFHFPSMQKVNNFDGIR